MTSTITCSIKLHITCFYLIDFLKVLCFPFPVPVIRPSAKIPLSRSLCAREKFWGRLVGKSSALWSMALSKFTTWTSHFSLANLWRVVLARFWHVCQEQNGLHAVMSFQVYMDWSWEYVTCVAAVLVSLHCTANRGSRFSCGGIMAGNYWSLARELLEKCLPAASDSHHVSLVALVMTHFNYGGRNVLGATIVAFTID